MASQKRDSVNESSTRTFSAEGILYEIEWCVALDSSSHDQVHIFKQATFNGTGMFRQFKATPMDN